MGFEYVRASGAGCTMKFEGPFSLCVELPQSPNPPPLCSSPSASRGWGCGGATSPVTALCWPSARPFPSRRQTQETRASHAPSMPAAAIPAPFRLPIWAIRDCLPVGKHLFGLDDAEAVRSPFLLICCLLNGARPQAPPHPAQRNSARLSERFRG